MINNWIKKTIPSFGVEVSHNYTYKTNLEINMYECDLNKTTNNICLQWLGVI